MGEAADAQCVGQHMLHIHGASHLAGGGQLAAVESDPLHSGDGGREGGNTAGRAHDAPLHQLGIQLGHAEACSVALLAKLHRPPEDLRGMRRY